MNTFKLWVWDADLVLLWRWVVRTLLECRTARVLSNDSSLDENVQWFAGSQAKYSYDLTQKERLEQAIASLHRLTSITFEADYVEQILEIYLRYIY